MIIALPGATVRQAVGPDLQGDFRLALGNDWTRHRRAEQIRVLVNSSSTERGPDVITNKFFPQILHMRGRCARGERFLARSFQVFLLADVPDDGDDLAAVVLLEPGNDDGGVETSGIREYHFLWFVLLSFHDSSFDEKFKSLRFKSPKSQD